MGSEPQLSHLDRLVQQAMGADRKLGSEDDPARKKFPALWEWLSRIYVGRDNIKQPAVLSIRLGPQGVLVTLTDRDLSVSFDMSCAHLQDTFAAMEAAIVAPNPPMRNWGKREPSVRKRKHQG
jgi:hypothetical protein